MLKNKVAVVTGGSSGIGASVSEALAREGASVAVVASRDANKAHRVVDRITAAGGHAKPFAADVRSTESVATLFQQVDTAFGGVDILINAAGVYYATPVAATPDADISNMIDINLKGAWNCISAAVPRLKARGGGRIINFSSVAAYLGLGGFSMYCATKAAIVMMTRSLACGRAKFDINVNAIAPGNTATPMNETFRSDPESREYLAAMTKVTPSRVTFSDPAEIADAVLFMVTRGRAMHGTTLLMDEGLAAGLVL